jgi:hypothetical protein
MMLLSLIESVDSHLVSLADVSPPSTFAVPFIQS